MASTPSTRRARPTHLSICAQVPEGHKVAVFANGCFWGSEKGIWRFPYGIYSTAVGYCAGFTPNPTYNEACSGMTGHTEGVRVVYDPEQISFADILRWFWAVSYTHLTLPTKA